MKTNALLLVIVAFLMSLVTAEARDPKPQKTASAPAAAAPAEKKRGFISRLLFRDRAKPAAPIQAPAAARPKPKPNLAETSAARRSQGQRPDPKRSATKAVSATASAKVTPNRSAAPATPKVPANVLAKAPAPTPVDTSLIQEAYSTRSVLGRAMRSLWSSLSGEAAKPTTVEQKLLPRVRVTAYHNDDADSAAKRSSTQVQLRPATPTQIGVAAGPAELLGSYAIVKRDGVELRYLIADTGSDVEKKTASDGEAPVIDLYEPREKDESVEEWQDWESYQPVRIVQIKGASHLLLQKTSVRDEFLRLEVFEHALSLSVRS
jgi:hypothetical protein